MFYWRNYALQGHLLLLLQIQVLIYVVLIWHWSLLRILRNVVWNYDTYIYFMCTQIPWKYIFASLASLFAVTQLGLTAQYHWRKITCIALFTPWHHIHSFVLQPRGYLCCKMDLAKLCTCTLIMFLRFIHVLFYTFIVCIFDTGNIWTIAKRVMLVHKAHPCNIDIMSLLTWIMYMAKHLCVRNVPTV